MKHFLPSGKGLLAASLAIVASISTGGIAKAAGDLLVAPTRVVLDGRRGTEVVLNNVGTEESTYRISLVLRRMSENGKLVDVADEEVNDKEEAVRSIIRYAPRRVTLPPNQPQAIRLAIRGTEALEDGEYRAHMLFRAIPKTRAVTEAKSAEQGLKIELIPVYGVTIPIIIRKGQLQAIAAVSNPKLLDEAGGKVLALDLSRQGDKSVYGEIRVTKAGLDDPVLRAQGIAVYPEIESRKVLLPLRPEQAAAIRGPVTIGYYHSPANGGGVISEINTVIQ